MLKNCCFWFSNLWNKNVHGKLVGGGIWVPGEFYHSWYHLIIRDTRTNRGYFMRISDLGIPNYSKTITISTQGLFYFLLLLWTISKIYDSFCFDSKTLIIFHTFVSDSFLVSTCSYIYWLYISHIWVHIHFDFFISDYIWR